MAASTIGRSAASVAVGLICGAATLAEANNVQ